MNINTLFSIAVLATKKTHTSLNLIITTTKICVDIPSDAYPIFLCLDNSFKVYSQHEPIFANKAQIQDFSDYMSSPCLSGFIHSFATIQFILLPIRFYIILLTNINFSYQQMDREPTTKVVAVGSLHWLMEKNWYQDITLNLVRMWISTHTIQKSMRHFLLLPSLPLNNDIHATCDNKSYVTKMNDFISHPYTKLYIHKIKESEDYLAILSCLPTNFVITHIKGHQDGQKSY